MRNDEQYLCPSCAHAAPDWCNKRPEITSAVQSCGSYKPLDERGADKRPLLTDLESFVSMLASQHPAGGLTKAQILRMADRLMAGGRWEQDHVVLDGKTALEAAQERIAELECANSLLTQQLGRMEGQVEMLKTFERKQGG